MGRAVPSKDGLIRGEMTFVLDTFGKLRLAGEDGSVIALPEKGLLLLAYLLTLDEGSAYRTTVARFLWGETDNGASDTTLRKLLSRVKAYQSELGSSFVSFEGSTISIDRALLTSDIQLVRKDETSAPFARLRRLVKLLDQPFLGPVKIQSREFRSWVVDEGNRHVELLERTLREAHGDAQTRDDAEVLRKAAVILFRSEPQDPETLQLLLKIFNAEQDVESLQTYFAKRRGSIERGAKFSASDAGSGVKLAAEAKPPARNGAVAGLSAETGGIANAIPRLVLLPPSNQSVSPDAGLIASSLIEDITIGFCAFNSLRVIAPYSAVQIGHNVETQAAFFERQAVNYVLETRIGGSGDDVTLFAQLIFVDDAQVLWAERFGLRHLDLLRDKRAISRQIALSVSREIARHEEQRADIALNPEAYHRYLVGKRDMARMTLPNLRRARKEMKAALAASPDFAPALSAMGRTYSKEWLLTARGDIELLKQAENLSRQAIEKRSDFADGYREFGVAKLLQGDFDESAEAMEVAEGLAPHYADVIADHADTLVHCSRPSMALQKIERAIELNPLTPDVYLWTAAGANYALGEFASSIDYIGQMADPSLADRLAAASWAMMGHADKARILVRRVREANPNFDVDTWLAAVPSKEQWHKDLYREGLKKAGF
jgi:TolB-like protein/DNA-binding SARP family transcriptional activator